MEEKNWPNLPEASEIKIRTRGPLHTRGSQTVTRTRGGVRTRGAAQPEAQPLLQLVTAVREQAHGSPSAVVIHRWEDASAQMFFRCLSPLLEGDDAIWLVPANAAQRTELPAAWPEAVVLDFSRDADQRTYANLVADIVFFPAGEIEEVDQWYGRAEAVVISAAEPALIEHARQNDQEVYLWSEAEPDTLVRI